MLRQKENKHLKSETKRSFHFIRIFLLASTLLLTSPKYLLAQYNVDSIKGLSYEEFKTYFRKNHVDTVKDLIYANAFLEKAKKDKDTIRMADAYLKLSDIHTSQIGLIYTDSSILISRNLVCNKDYPALGYISKGNIYSYSGELQKAIDQYIIAQKYAKKNKNHLLMAAIKVNIGCIKNDLGEKEEALIIFKDFINYIKEVEIPNKTMLLAKGLFALADAYTSIQQYDSANMVIEQGVKITLKENYIDIYASFLNSLGANLYYLQKYQCSIDTIQKAITLYDLQSNASYAYLYIGKSKLAMGDTIEALEAFFAVDSFLSSNNYITQELLEVYTPLIEYYNQKKDYKNQLLYTNRLIKFDSVFDATKDAVSKEITKKYDIPLLIDSKEKLLKRLDQEKDVSARNTYLLLTISILLIVIILYFFSKHVKYRNQFNNILKQNEINDKAVLNKKVIKNKIERNNFSSIDNELVKAILQKLDNFEKKMLFTKKNYTLNKLAKDFKTNSTYLSKIINEYKGQNFSNYLRNLRINYAISQIKTDAKFRTYTIQAIAEEVGFNKAQSFSTAFHDKVGVYPSSFIKTIEEQSLNE